MGEAGFPAGHRQPTGAGSPAADLVELSPDAVLVHREQRIVLANRAAARMFGASKPEQLVGMALRELVSPEFHDLVFTRAAMLISARHEDRIDLRIRRLDGETREVETAAAACELGGPAVQLVLRDLSARKQVERSFERQGAVLAAIARIFEAALSCETEEALGRKCLAIAEEITGSKFGFIGEVNAGTNRLDDVAISDPGWEACRMRRRGGRGEGNARLGFEIHGIYGRVLLDGKSLVSNDPGSHPDRIGTPPGHPRLTAFLGVPLRQGHRTWGMIGLGNREGGYGPSEVAAAEALAPAMLQAFLRKRAEEKLRASEERLRAAFEASPDAININRMRDAVYTSVNDGFVRLSGWSREEVIGRSASEISIWVDAEQRQRTLERLVRGEAIQSAETTFRRKDGTLLTGSLSAQTFLAGGERFLLAITRDVSDLKRAESELREADRRKDEFLAMLSHELRNPLAPIRNSTYLLQRAATGSEQARRAQGVIQRQTEHLTRLVDDLLDVTRIARGKIELRRVQVDLRDVVLRAAEDFRLLLDERGVAFHLKVPAAKVVADADPTRLTQVVGNLLHNAAKFTRRGEEVTLSLAVVDGFGEIGVRDTGAGIDPELLPSVFDAFVQGARTLARTEGGLGLGLALVKGITELHGGSVRGESGGIGQGTEFVVRLPLLHRAVAPDAPAASAPQVCERGRRLLVVDDNRDAAESLADILRWLGHAVEVAYDGPSALEMVRANPPEVVLCDLGLPGMSGYEVATALRREGLSGTRLIAVSGYAQPEDVSRALEAGFDAHVAKPCDPEQLARLLG